MVQLARNIFFIAILTTKSQEAENAARNKWEDRVRCESGVIYVETFADHDLKLSMKGCVTFTFEMNNTGSRHTLVGFPTNKTMLAVFAAANSDMSHEI